MQAKLRALVTGIDGCRIAVMKPAGFIAKAAHREIIGQTALIETLRKNRIAGAALDARKEKAPANGHPLNARDKLFLSPHTVGHTSDSALHNGGQVAADLVAVFSRQRPGHPVNPAARPRGMERIDILAAGIGNT